MRPFKLDANEFSARKEKVGMHTARKQVILEQCKAQLELVGLSAGEPSMVTRAKRGVNGQPLKDGGGKEVMETVQLIGKDGQPRFENVDMDPETLILYQVCSTLIELLTNEWTYS